MSFPTTPPLGTTPRPWQFPDRVERRLPWGLQLAAVRMAALPIVHVRWSFRVGRSAEPADRLGVGRLLSSVARHGTARWDSGGLATALDHLGARLSVAVGGDNAIVSVTALSEHIDEALDLVDEVAMRPALREADIERERAKALQLLRHSRSQPEHLAGLWLGRALYADHPYGRPPSTEAGLLAVDRDDMVEFHQRLTDPRDALLMVVGDVDPDAMVERLAARWAAPEPWVVDRPHDAPVIEPTSGVDHRRVIAVDRPGSEQVAILLGHPLFSRPHPDYLAVRLANQVLGGGASARLFMELRERRSLTYGCYSALDVGVLGGDFSASLACSPDKAAEAVQALVAELRRAASGDVEADELAHAQNYLVGAFPQRASGVGGVAALVNREWLHGMPSGTWSRYQADLAAVTLDDVNDAARRWLRPDAASIVVVGPGDVAAASVSWLGEVERRDAADLGYESGTGLEPDPGHPA